MKPLLTVSLLALSLSAQADYTVTTGSKTGTYHRIGGNLLNILAGGTRIASKGSMENLERLDSGEAQVGIVQLDAYAYYKGKHPDSKTEVILPLGKECIHIAVKEGGKVRDEDDLQSKKGVVIAVGKDGSGTAVSWKYMMGLEEGYKNASVLFKGGARAFAKLALGSDQDGVDAVMWVSTPSPKDKWTSYVANTDGIKMIDVNDMDLNDTYKPLGRPIYEFDKIVIKEGAFSDDKVKVPCVDYAIVAQGGEEFMDDLSEAVVSYKSTLLSK